MLWADPIGACGCLWAAREVRVSGPSEPSTISPTGWTAGAHVNAPPLLDEVRELEPKANENVRYSSIRNKQQTKIRAKQRIYVPDMGVTDCHENHI